MNQENSLLTDSDKTFWHGYIDFYEPHLQLRTIRSIAEIGISKGHSIRWLLARFPEASIFGADIIERIESWPVDQRFKDVQMDQGDTQQLRQFFSNGPFDLIIEDGSHQPEHQVLALIEGIQSVNSNGIYILEDIHTSHPTSITRLKKGLAKLSKPKSNALNFLLGLAHYLRISKEITHERLQRLTRNSIISEEQGKILIENIKSIHFYRRTRLPERCVHCGSTEYNFDTMRCVCGARVFSDFDSMTFVIEKK